MKVVITGGAGFLGRRLATRLLELGTLTGPDGEPRKIEKLVLLDMVAAQGLSDPRVQAIAGDITEPELLRDVIGSDTSSVFHLAAVVSGQAEADFDLGMRVNLHASLSLLEICRASARRPRVVFTSSVAVFGGVLPEFVRDDTALKPRSSYGAQKAIGELLVSDYSRKGFVDGRILRLPTISVRPGLPNKAASSFASGIIREPLKGEDAVCPVPTDTRLWLLSPRFAIEALIKGHEISGEALGDDRSISLPGLSVTVKEMIESLSRVAGADVAARIHLQPDETITRIVRSWPGAFDTTRANALGFKGDDNFDDIVRAHIEDTRA